MEFGVLGLLEVTADGRSLGPTGARTRAVLAMLLVHANQVVSSDRLIDELWPGHPAARLPAAGGARGTGRAAVRAAGHGPFGIIEILFTERSGFHVPVPAVLSDG